MTRCKGIILGDLYLKGCDGLAEGRSWDRFSILGWLARYRCFCKWWSLLLAIFYCLHFDVGVVVVEIDVNMYLKDCGCSCFLIRGLEVGILIMLKLYYLLFFEELSFFILIHVCSLRLRKMLYLEKHFLDLKLLNFSKHYEMIFIN